jgi:hypothetical protein
VNSIRPTNIYKSYTWNQSPRNKDLSGEVDTVSRLFWHENRSEKEGVGSQEGKAGIEDRENAQEFMTN